MTHFPAKAKRVLQVFCPGAASHMDLWEHKPELDRRHGEPLPGEEDLVSFQGKNGNLMKSPWPFRPAGESGKAVSTLLPHMARHVDDIAFIHSMTSKTNTHGPGCVFMNTGHDTEGFPGAGAWMSYALGRENEDLPAYVALPDLRGEPPNGKANWSNGFLPARHQAIVMAAHRPIRNLERPDGVGPDEEADTRDLVAFLNDRHAEAHPGDEELRARIAAYELAGRMQTLGPRGLRPRLGVVDDPPPLRHRRPEPAEGGLREELPARPPPARAGRPLRQPLLRQPGLGRRRPAQLGRAPDPQARLRAARPDLRPADGGACSRT